MWRKGYDNGAVAPTSASDRKGTKKNRVNAGNETPTKGSKEKVLEKELVEERTRSALLREELKKTRDDMRKLEATVEQLTSNSIHPTSESDLEFDGGQRPSSTRQNVTNRSYDESRFLTSVNHLSMSSINIPECKPLEEGDEIHRHTFESWKDLLIDSMNLAGVTDEQTRFTIFKVKAGSRLLEVFRNTRSTNDAPAAESKPFANAMHRLNSYFASGSDIMLQRRKLALMVQKERESDLTFVSRVASTARLCNFGEGKEMEEIVGTVAEHATHKEVRSAALKMLSRKGTYTDLVDKVRELEAIRINEEYYERKYHKQPVATLAPIRADMPSRSGREFRMVERRSGSYGSRGISGQTGRQGTDHHRGGGKASSGSSRIRCWRCDSVFHHSDKCFAIDKDCIECGEIGHIRRACPNLTAAAKRPKQEAASSGPPPKRMAIASSGPPPKRMATFEEAGLDERQSGIASGCDNLIAPITTIKPFLEDGCIMAEVAGMVCEFLIDSGAQVNTFTESLFERMRRNESYNSKMFNVKRGSDRPLKAYASEKEIPVSATFEAHLFISNGRPILIEKFYVVDDRRALLSRSTSIRYCVLLLGLEVPVLDQPNRCEGVQISRILCEEPFPKFNIPPVKLNYDKEKPPCRNIFMNVPQALKPFVEQRLRNLVATGIIEPVSDEMSVDFCSSMLVVPKGKADIRLVIDLRGPNRYILRTPFSMPTLEGIVAGLNGASWFSTIDLQNAFFHIALDEESRHLTNFYTEFGMFRCVRLPFGLCNAPDIFQEVVQRKILNGCKGVVNYLDDILVFGATKEEHDANLDHVMTRLKEHNVKLNLDKCVFGAQVVRFVGFKLTPDGWQVENDKVQALKNFRPPQSCSEVKSFLGLVTFTDRFIMNRADKTIRLRALATADHFYWTEAEELEFDFLRYSALKQIKTLGYYSMTDRTELYVDASPVGLGAVLMQWNPSGKPRVIACASKALTTTERKYPQTQKEALALVWGAERFSFYLLGQTFVIRTDAEANEFIFNSQHRLGKRAVSRAEAWALRLQPFDFTIERVTGELNVADALSRLINEAQEALPFEEEDSGNLLYALDAGVLDITWDDIESCSESDSEIGEVREAVKSGIWPENLRRFEAQRKHLYVLGCTVFKNDRVILPGSLRQKAMSSAHVGHIGEVNMKRIMREFFWWPGMAKEVEKFIKSCETCTLLARKSPPQPLSSREMPENPWEIIQIDFLSIPGFGTGEFLVTVDIYSRYLSVVEMKQMDADHTNAALCDIFQRWGLPRVLQSDNGPPFQSSAFVSFWEEKGVKVRKAIPLSPQTNGAVERQNPGITKAMASAKLEGKNWRWALNKYVHNHNTIVPHSRLRVTPFEMLVGWKFRGTFPSLWHHREQALDRIDIRERDAETKLISKKYADTKRGAKPSKVEVGDTVLILQQKKTKTDPTFSSEPFTVVAKDGAKLIVLSKGGVQYTRHIQDVKKAPEQYGDTGDQVQEVALTVPESINRSAQDGMLVLPATDVLPTLDSTDKTRILRTRHNINRPARFDSKYVYHIFQ